MALTYRTVTHITDFGPYITDIILPFPCEITASAVDAGKFSLYCEHLNDRGEVIYTAKSFLTPDELTPSKGYIDILDAFPSDESGNRLEKGSFVTLKPAFGPLSPLSSGLSVKPHGMHEFFHTNSYRITQTAEIETDGLPLSGLVFDTLLGNASPDTKGFIHGVSSYKKLPLRYGMYAPASSQVKKPLVIFLHGAGEGGTDTAIAYAGNKVVALAAPYAQDIFGGAYVLVPQCPTYWMDDGKGVISTSGKTIYTEALKALIDEFISLHPDIDTDRIYIGGDSNGGFMTMRMIIDHPGFFAAAYPLCEALRDDCISDAELNILAETPIWFVSAVTDPVVPVDEFDLPTYKRLIAAGAKDVHLTMWDDIRDIHEGFKNADGTPYLYIGHFAWIPMLDDDCRLDYDGKPVTINGREVTLMQWLASHTLSKR